jgi:hypothetical protein
MAKQDTKPTKEKFSLPSSSAEELKKILSSYARKSGEVSLEDVARVTGINVTNVSRNSGFLTDAGLITGSKTKTCTELGQRLGHAFDHERSDEIKVGLTEMVQSTPFLSELLDTVRMRKGMSESDFASHILYAAGIGKDTRKKTGANAIIDFLVQGGLLVSNDGNLTVAATPNNNVSSPQIVLEPEHSEAFALPTEPVSPNISTAAPVVSAATTSGPFSISINIQLELPASTDPVVYENLFKSMKKHLLSGDE